MEQQLIEHISKFAKIDFTENEGIGQYFRKATFSKKENLHVAGKACRANYFVVKGCLRMFFINEKGVEQTILFALENWWMTDLMSYHKQIPSEFYIQAVENTQVIYIEYDAQNELLDLHPGLEKYFRIMYQHATAASQMRMKYMYTYSKEEYYKMFNRSYPEFIQRIPQYLLASFLGFTPEYLSEIRKKNIS